MHTNRSDRNERSSLAVARFGEAAGGVRNELVGANHEIRVTQSMACRAASSWSERGSGQSSGWMGSSWDGQRRWGNDEVREAAVVVVWEEAQMGRGGWQRSVCPVLGAGRRARPACPRRLPCGPHSICP